MYGPHLPTIGAIPPEHKVYLPPFDWLSDYYDNYFFPLREIRYDRF